ncbi:hypothetical protein [Natrinema amylolyticum]|uniref:hypothetical protein n=1 Tax=Natrinema amylolyticum TaxID=2878679 RepID=UPI001CFAB575|nr:hypothetical protein [Natrinema amylolyticum]
MADEPDEKNRVKQIVQEELKENTFFGRYWLNSHESVSLPLKLLFGTFFMIFQAVISSLVVEFAQFLITHPIMLLVMVLFFSLLLNGALYLQYKKGQENIEEKLTKSVEEKIEQDQRGRRQSDSGRVLLDHRQSNLYNFEDRKRLSDIESHLDTLERRIKQIDHNQKGQRDLTGIESRLEELEQEIQQTNIEDGDSLSEEIRENKEYLTRIYQRLIEVEEEVGINRQSNTESGTNGKGEESQSSKADNSAIEDTDKEYELE